jgi:hypothetical protein
LQYATNANGLLWSDTAWNDLPGGLISSYSPVYTGAVVYVTQKLASLGSLRVVQVGSTNVSILSVGEWDNSKPGVILSAQISHQGTGTHDYVKADPRVVIPVLRAWAPVMFFYDDEESMDAFFPWATTNITFPTDLVLVAPHMAPLPEFQQNYVDTQRNIRMARTNHVAFFDGEAACAAAWGDYTNAITLGLASSNSVPHLLDSGYSVFGKLLWSWMGLSSYSH